MSRSVGFHEDGDLMVADGDVGEVLERARHMRSWIDQHSPVQTVLSVGPHARALIVRTAAPYLLIIDLFV